MPQHAQAPPGLSLTNDLVFKTLFSRQLHLLSDLLNAMLRWPAPVAVLKVLNPEVLAQHVEGKRVVLDILARDQAGALFVIEMQVRREEPWPQRNVYYLARGLSEQMRSGQGYEDLLPVIGISLLAHDLFTQHPGQAVWRLALRDEQTPSVGFNEALQLHIIELPKAERLGGLPPALSAWVSCLLHNLDETIMNQITHPPVQEALQHLQELSADEALRWAALQREIALLDERTALNRARREGHEEGRQEGRAEGQAVLLEQLLSRKFGSLPAAAVKRIRQADAAQLQAWSLSLLDASSLDDVLDCG